MAAIGKVLPTEIISEMETSYINYAMSVIMARALPDVRDGLKPVHRRIIYAMHRLGLHHSSRYSKSAKVVGEVLGKYHPHGDMPVYDALVRMAQDFSMRHMLVDGQGNFGSVDGDSPAAMRYTECRLASISDELLRDLDKETVEWLDNFDGTLKEPTVLPSVIPNLLINGTSGIAVGMATNIPTHNLGEVIDALLYMVDHPVEQAESEKVDLGSKVNGKTNGNATKTNGAVIATDQVFESAVNVEDLIKFIKGPDFPTAGIIYDQKEIIQAYATGKGRVVMRAKAEIEEVKGGRFDIIISELPYQVNKAMLVARIADLVKDKKVEGISDLRDESDRRGLRVVVELKRDARPQSVLNNLFKYTAMQSVFNVNMVALVDGTPQLLSLKAILEEFVEHRRIIITRRTRFELAQARAREHILEGLKIAVDNIDEVIRIIRASKDVDTAKKNLMTKFKLSDLQSTAILDMQLRRLAALERQKIEDELKEVRKLITYLEDLLAHPEKILLVIKKELNEIKEKYADPRKTKVVRGGVGEFSEEDLIAAEQTIITLTKGGYIKRQGVAAFRTQQRGGKGVSGVTLKEEDAILNIIPANTHDNILFFTNKGRVFQTKAWEITEASRIAKGQALVNVIDLASDETVTSVLPVAASNGKASTSEFAFMVTKKGTVKKTKISEYANIRKSGLISIKLEAGDSLIWAKMTEGNDNIMLMTSDGRSIRFNESDVRSTARDTMGVRGILLKKDDYIVGMDVISTKDVATYKTSKDPKQPQIVSVMENGLGKRSLFSDYPLQKRGGQGVKAASVTERTGKLVFSAVVPQDCKYVILTSTKGQTIKLPVTSVPLLKRDTQGVILMRMQTKEDKVATAAMLAKEEETS